MAASILVDAGFLAALISRGDANHRWAAAQAARYPPPWKTCEATLSEAFHLLGPPGSAILSTLLRRRAAVCTFHPAEHIEELLKLMQKYAHVPMSFADACLVRMTETISDPVLLTTDADFRLYRRHGRKTVPCVLPGYAAVGPSDDGKPDLTNVLRDIARIFRDET
jgi:predicted nucleic acid-binding protein